MSVKDNSCGIADLQDKMLSILKVLIRICDKKSFRYYLAGGTCIGALRHRGFIPWDDDLDVYMPRDDYEKLWSLVGNKIIYGHYKLCRTTAKKNYHHRVMQIVDLDTTFINKRSENEDIEHGIYIDIIPIDARATTKVGQLWQFFNAVIFSIFNIQCKQEFNGGKLTRYINFITALLLRLVKNPRHRYKIWKKAEKNMVAWDWDTCREYIVLTSTIKELTHPFPKTWLENNKAAEFEDISAQIMGGSDEYCRMMYGDYMKFPPADQQCVKHNTVYIDLNTPYTCYKGQYYCKEDRI